MRLTGSAKSRLRVVRDIDERGMVVRGRLLSDHGPTTCLRERETSQTVTVAAGPPSRRTATAEPHP